MHIGFIKLHRKLLDWEWYSDTNVMRVFTHFLLKANYEDNKWKGQLIKSGQLICGNLQLSKELGLSVQQIRTALNKLKSTSEITVKATSQYSIITLNNWIKYQSINNQDNKPLTNEQQTNNKPSTTLKEVKNKRIKEVNEVNEIKRDIYLDNDINLLVNHLKSLGKPITNTHRKMLSEALNIEEDTTLWVDVFNKCHNKGHLIGNTFKPVSIENMIENYSKILEDAYGLEAIKIENNKSIYDSIDIPNEVN